jgi:hypothetical protein
MLLSASPNVFSCGGGEYWEGMFFYNLFNQTNISSEEYYPFLKTEMDAFYGESYGNENVVDPKGNLLLWKEILTDWEPAEIKKEVYDFPSFNWASHNSSSEKRTRKYLEFAQECTDAFRYRNHINSWDYNEIADQNEVDTEALLSKVNLLLNKETNEQLKARYCYQLIRILHYSKLWSDAIKVFENQIENKIPKNELYYYIVDQVAGCYYSTENYDKAAYLFTKVVNHSYDRKKSAFSSYDFCVRKGYEGRQYFEGVEDEKDLLLIKSLYNFSDRLSNVNEFIALDANDDRIELLFMRLLNSMERNAWPKDIGASNQTLPNVNDNSKENIIELISVAREQNSNPKVKNKDFWRLASSYLYFTNQDLELAKLQLQKVQSFKKQKQILSAVYQVFSWDAMSREQEDAFMSLLSEDASLNQTGSSILESQQDWLKMILDRIAHLYYKQGDLAKAFLIHNKLEVTNYLTSPELLISMENLDSKPDKSDFEKVLLANKTEDQDHFGDYVLNQKGIYFLLHNKLDSAQLCFNRMQKEVDELLIPAQIFSNNTREGFRFPVDKIMQDEVYKADVFSFIKPNFTRKELAENLLQLEELRQDSLQWKQKLANYLLGNFYFNISNTGYYRGSLNNRSNIGQYRYVPYTFEREDGTKYDAEIIRKRIGYNLSNIEIRRKKYNATCDVARAYYQEAIRKSTDNELNARCTFMLAKCDLNDYYNKGSEDTFDLYLEYWEVLLPKSESYKLLKEKYANTKFHEMIIQECSYFRAYSALD